MRVGFYQSSPTLKRGYQVVDYWKKRLEYKLGDRKCVSARLLINIQRRLGLSYHLLSLQQIKQQLNKASQQLKKIKLNAKALHIEHRQQLAEALAAEGNISASTHIKMRLT